MNILNHVTRKTLLKNRTRTVVTIIGVILSAAMITAITTFISSMQDFMIRSITASEGGWQASVRSIPYSKAAAIAGDGSVASAGILRPLGSALLDGCANPDKPYLYVQALDSEAFALTGLTPTEGRLPQNDRELLISEHVRDNGGVSYRLGQTITLPIGERMYTDGYAVAGNAPYLPDDSPERLDVRETRTFTVVGFCARPSSEDYSAAGYSVFTFLDRDTLAAEDTVSISLTARSPYRIYETMERLAGNADVQYHANLLRYSGVSQNDSFLRVLYSMAAILIALIMVGSISLIYNAFAISVSERSRQFGMLSSAGATSRQIRRSVFYEALVISGIGIPLGLIAGVGGIGITLYFLGDAIAATGGVSNVPFRLSVSVLSLVIAAAVGLATVLISAYIPARRAARMSAIDAIRQTGDIRLKARQVRTSPLIRRLFGLEGDLALKNFKRNRRRYRATVLSLFISVVLFISVSTYTDMLKRSVSSFYSEYNYDIEIYMRDRDPDGENGAAFLTALKGLDSVREASMLRGANAYYMADKDAFDPDTWELAETLGNVMTEYGGEMSEADRASLGWKEGEENYEARMRIYALDESELTRYLQTLGLNPADYTDPAHPRGIVLDRFLAMDKGGRYVDGHVFRGEPLEITVNSRSVWDSAASGNQTVPLMLAAFAEKAPLGMQDIPSGGLYSAVRVIVSQEVLDACFGEGFGGSPPSFAVSADDPVQAEKDIQRLIKQQATGYSLVNHAANQQENRNTMLVVSVLSYGFIVLISLITVANVFNTISTNVGLRRREFAMLKSVGMTRQGFDKMMNFECLFYGLKALLYGLPVSAGVVWLIRASLGQGLEMDYGWPWLSFGVAILAVFLVVFITMLYAMSKIRKENIIDALKNENL